jgi:hypothetical protein
MHRPVTGPALWIDVARAVFHLVRARAALSSADLVELVGADNSGTTAPADPADFALIDRIAYVIPRVGRRLPWRSDCLIQAHAAQRWLAAHSIPSSIRIGGRTRESRFDAHAWLIAGETIVTGWDNAEFDTYAEFASSDHQRTQSITPKP